MKISARNILKGKVVAITKGPVTSNVKGANRQRRCTDGPRVYRGCGRTEHTERRRRERDDQIDRGHDRKGIADRDKRSSHVRSE